jgi:hypothetical protein
VSQAVLDQVPGKFIAEKAHEAKVKGKSEPLVIYRVLGTVDANGRETRVETEYSSYAAERSDKVVHDSPAAARAPAPMPEPAVSAEPAPMPELAVAAEPPPMPELSVAAEPPPLEAASAPPEASPPAGADLLFPDEHTAALSLVDIPAEEPPKDDEAA